MKVKLKYIALAVAVFGVVGFVAGSVFKLLHWPYAAEIKILSYLLLILAALLTFICLFKANQQTR